MAQGSRVEEYHGESGDMVGHRGEESAPGMTPVSFISHRGSGHFLKGAFESSPCLHSGVRFPLQLLKSYFGKGDTS